MGARGTGGVILWDAAAYGREKGGRRVPENRATLGSPPAGTVPPAPLYAPEERTLTLPTTEWAESVWLGERRLAFLPDRERTPYVENVTAREVQIRLTDWVGPLTFRLQGERQSTEQQVIVYPAKLSREPERALEGLRIMLGQLPELRTQLHLPAELQRAQVTWHPPQLGHDLRELAAQGWAVWQAARRQPGVAGRRRTRRVAGGQVPDRVDWNLTLAAWSRGDFPQHVALDLAPPALAPGTGALLELWEALRVAAQALPAAEAQGLLGELGRARATFPRPLAGELASQERRQPAPLDPYSAQLRQLTARVREKASAVALPVVRMAELYEFWSQLTLARRLGAVHGEYSRQEGGLYQGSLWGVGDQSGLRVTLNPKLTFGGVGLSLHTLQPDLLAVFPDDRALVAEVKYRPLDRLLSEQQREVNDQLLRYMAVSHADTGLFLWPGGDTQEEGERLRIREFPGGRARLVRLRLHPLDPPEQLSQDLRSLGLSVAGEPALTSGARMTQAQAPPGGPL